MTSVIPEKVREADAPLAEAMVNRAHYLLQPVNVSL